MIACASPLLNELESVCETGVLESFAAFVRGRDFGGDTNLAELIEVDARARLECGHGVELGRYFEAVPGLEGMPIALDAAIEFTLRSWSGASRPSPAAVERLERMYPRLGPTIRNSAALSDGLAATEAVRRAGGLPAGPRRRERVLPADFGARTHDGLARYELRQRLGQGSQGEVYLACDRALSDEASEAMVAVKILGAKAMSETDRWRALDEAAKARRMDHPNVVRVLDRGDDPGGEEYIVYEHVAGGDLETWRRARGVLSAREAAGLISSIARGVQAAHAAGLVHRDLKPANVLMGRDPGGTGGLPVPKIADFGVAALIGPRDERRGRPGERIGNLAFIAPEQYRNEDAGWSATVDVFALGGMLFHLLTGRLPNGATAEEVAATHDPKTGRAEAPIPSTAGGRLDRDLEAICRRAMAPLAADRYASADALAGDLDRWLGFESIAWARPGVGRRAALLLRRQPRGVALGAMAAAAVLATTAASVYVYMSQRERVAVARVEASLAGERAEVVEHSRQIIGAGLAGMKATFGPGGSADTGADWFPMLTVLESLAGPYVFDPREGPEPWSRRVSVASDALRAARVGGHGESLEALLWSDTLAFWLLREGEHERAEALLRKFDGAWDRALGPDDPWRELRGSLKAAGVVQRVAAAAAAGKVDPAQYADLAQAERALVAAEASLSERHLGDSVHRLVVGTLVRAYDPGMLDRPERLRWAEGRAEAIRNIGSGRPAAVAGN